MTKTYPRWPQPIISHPVTGLNWYLELTNAGVIRAGGTTTDAPTPISRLRLVDPTGQAGYKIGLSSDVPTPTVTATALSSPQAGNYQDLSVWAVNGREWNLRVTAGGTITINAIASDWPMLQPVTGERGQFIQSYNASSQFDGIWSMAVTDAGILEMTGPVTTVPIKYVHRVNLLDETGNNSWEILQYSPTSTMIVSGPNSPSLATYYEMLFISPNGLRFALSVDSNGILYVDNGLEDIDAANEWPLVLQSRNNILYVVDKRFPPPVPGMRGRGYGRRRG